MKRKVASITMASDHTAWKRLTLVAIVVYERYLKTRRLTPFAIIKPQRILLSARLLLLIAVTISTLISC